MNNVNPDTASVLARLDPTTFKEMFSSGDTSVLRMEDGRELTDDETALVRSATAEDLHAATALREAELAASEAEIAVLEEARAWHNYPVSLDVCSACNLRINGVDPGSPAPPAYTDNIAKYATITSSTDNITDQDSGQHDDGLCHLCDEPNISGMWWDATARRA